MNALIIGTETSIKNFESGAALRIKYLQFLLHEAGFKVAIVGKLSAKKHLKNNTYSIIVLSSYSCASLARMARKKTEVLWFDPFDSWLASRMSRARGGHPTQLLALLKDIFWICLFPKREIVTFISPQDAARHQYFLRNDTCLVLPIMFDKPPVSHTDTVRLVFIGDGRYQPNRDALKFLELVAQGIGKKIVVMGEGYPQNRSPKYFDYLGYVPTSQVFHTNDIFLVPVNTGAGIKTKAALPLALGLRVVATEHSKNGLLDNSNLWVASSVGEFIIILKSLLMDNDWRYCGHVDAIYSHDDSDLIRNFLLNFVSTRGISSQE